MILNGDGFLITTPEIQDGWSLIVYPEVLKNVYKALGVVVVWEGGRVEGFIEKPPARDFWSLVGKINRDNPQHPFVQIADSDRTLANSASGIISFQSTRRQAQTIQTFLELHQWIAKNPREVDTSNHLLAALVKSRDRYLNDLAEKLAKDKGVSLTAARTEIEAYFGRIYDAVVRLFDKRLYGVGQATSFYRDPAETRMLIKEYAVENDLFRYFNFSRRDPLSHIHLDTQIDPNATIAQSQIARKVKVGPAALVMKSHLYQRSRVGAGSFVYRVKGKLDLGEDEWITTIPMAAGQAIVYLGIQDDTRASIEKARLFGEPLKKWMKEKELEFLLASLPEKQRGLVDEEAIWNLPIWPVQSKNKGRAINFSLVAWMSRVGERPPQAYLDTPKVSLADLSRPE